MVNRMFSAKDGEMDQNDCGCQDMYWINFAHILRPTCASSFNATCKLCGCPLVTFIWILKTYLNVSVSGATYINSLTVENLCASFFYRVYRYSVIRPSCGNKTFHLSLRKFLLWILTSGSYMSSEVESEIRCLYLFGLGDYWGRFSTYSVQRS